MKYSLFLGVCLVGLKIIVSKEKIWRGFDPKELLDCVAVAVSSSIGGVLFALFRMLRSVYYCSSYSS